MKSILNTLFFVILFTSFLSAQNIIKRNLVYTRPKDKPPHISGQFFQVQEIQGKYRLIKDGEVKDTIIGAVPKSVFVEKINAI